MIRKTVAFYSIFLGICITGMWIMILITSSIPEGETEFTFHLISEFLMASLCFVSGILLLKNHRTAPSLNCITLGMVVYSVLNAAGYYGERNNSPMVTMFLLLLLLSVTAILFNILNFRKWVQ